MVAQEAGRQDGDRGPAIVRCALEPGGAAAAATEGLDPEEPADAPVAGQEPGRVARYRDGADPHVSRVHGPGGSGTQPVSRWTATFGHVENVLLDDPLGSATASADGVSGPAPPNCRSMAPVGSVTGANRSQRHGPGGQALPVIGSRRGGGPRPLSFVRG